MGALDGLVVLDLATFIAAPMCATLLGEFGAEVIKVEQPGVGDDLRRLGRQADGVSLWWLSDARNKKSITCNLRDPDGQRLVRRLCRRVDVVAENFRPGTLERWGLGYEALRAENPGLVMVRISAFGQTGPYRERPGFGNIAESMGGIRYITGWPDRPPLRVGLSLGDGIAGLYATIGALVAIVEARESGRGQVVDVALSESVFSMLESIAPEHGYDGRVRERTGNVLNGAAPSNTYLTADKHWLAVGGNGDGIFRRLCQGMGRPDLAEDPRYSSNQGRREHVEELDRIIGGWIAERTLDEAMEMLTAHDVPAGPVYSIADIAADPQYQARQMLVDVPDERVGHVLMPGVVPRLSRTPGAIRWPGPDLGAHTQEVLEELSASADRE